VAVFAPLIAPYEPNDVLVGEVEGVVRRAPPCVHLFGCDSELPQHILGTDGNTRDQFSRIVYGSRVSLTLGFFTVTIALVVGTLLGAIAGYTGGWLDNIIMRIMDVVLGFPSLLLAIAIVSVFGPGLRNALIAIAVVSIPAYARVMRAQVLAIKETDFVAAARALGAAPRQILLRRIVPNALMPLVVLATLGIATAILEAAGLSFLGLGAQPPLAEWGSMLATERNQVFTSPHLVFFPGLAIMITVLGFNLMGDGLRDALDPTLNR
ncbi:MAG: ABC transporter permease, partial [Acidimicrobiia bacterium]|nr:ABC transporter permease [Acidimicrobiia bacterium]